jgi:hypothetical protein
LNALGVDLVNWYVNNKDFAFYGKKWFIIPGGWQRVIPKCYHRHLFGSALVRDLRFAPTGSAVSGVLKHRVFNQLADTG